MKRPSKYKNKPIVVDGIRFASQAEARRDAELQSLARLGKIRDIKRQPRFPLVVNGAKVCTYVADWQYVELAGWRRERLRVVVEDKKGVQTPAFRIKFKLAQALHPEIEWRVT